MDIKKHIQIFLAVLVMDILISIICFSYGYNMGFEAGLKEGQVDALMKAAGKCFLHIEKEIRAR